MIKHVAFHPVRLLALVLWVSPMAASGEEYRTWKSPDGREIRAKMETHDLDRGTVRLQLEQGRSVELKYSQLSADDVAYLEGLAQQNGQEIMRTWTSSDGTKIVARQIAHDENTGTVTLRREDGREFTLAPERLSEEDRARVAARAAVVREAREKARAAVTALLGKTIRYQTATPEPRTYHVYYPPAYSAEKPAPMMLIFSPSGGGGGMIRNFQEPASKHGWVLVGVDGPKNGQDNTIGSKMVADMLPEIDKTVAFHDPQQLYTSGLSGGAIRAFMTVAEHDRPWKGVISLGGWLGPEPQNIKLPRGLAVAWVNGDSDRGANSYVDRDTKLVPGKCRLFPFPGGHVIGPTEVLEEAMLWVKENAR